MSELEQFLASRDALLTHRTDYKAAVAAFQWPALTHFNWGLDYELYCFKNDSETDDRYSKNTFSHATNFYRV